jgi:S1-C subfamily serine protease
MAACAPDPQPDSGVLYDRAKAASVEILIDGHLAGSGWFAHREGLVVTAAHVLKARRSQTAVISPVAGRLPADTMAVDRGHDLALLRVPASGAPYPFLGTARGMPAPGKDVYLFASPMFRHQIMLRGAVGRRSPTFEYLPDQGHYIEAYHISAPSPKGTSGGCWLDARGRVVGCQSGFVSERGVGLGIALVTGPEAIRRLVRGRTSVTTPSVGTAFEEFWAQPAGFIARFPEGAAGLVPVLPVKGGAAERAGLVGDLLITAVDSRPVQYRDELLRVIRAKAPGDELTFTVLPPDGADPRHVKVTLAPL